MKIFITLCMLMLTILPAAFAQSTIAEDLLLQQVNQKEYVRIKLSKTEAERLAQYQRESSNASVVKQQGENNTMMLEQYGQGNVVVLNQNGHNNTYEGTVSGENNLNELNQVGDNNTLVQDIDANNKHYIVNQIGSDNVLIQKERGNSTKSYKIEQKGNGMEVSITNGGGAIPIIVK